MYVSFELMGVQRLSPLAYFTALLHIEVLVYTPVMCSCRPDTEPTLPLLVTFLLRFLRPHGPFVKTLNDLTSSGIYIRNKHRPVHVPLTHGVLWKNFCPGLRNKMGVP